VDQNPFQASDAYSLTLNLIPISMENKLELTLKRQLCA